MPKLKAKWSVDKKALEDIHRGYEMNIEPMNTPLITLNREAK